MDTEQLLSRVAENLSVRRAFGAPYEKDGLLIIPVALVAGGGGGGEGITLPPGRLAGTGDRSKEPAADVARGSDGGLPAGSGGGFGGLVLPVGAYVVKGEEVHWVPTVSVTLIVLASLSVLRLLVRSRTRVRLRQHAHV
jgi:uncharacterized spore protein YtfJ